MLFKSVSTPIETEKKTASLEHEIHRNKINIVWSVTSIKRNSTCFMKRTVKELNDDENTIQEGKV